MKVLVNILFLILSIPFILYLLLPVRPFPVQPDGSLASLEPADLESIDRRGYFTDLSRPEVIEHYKKQFSYTLLGFKLYPIRLNYPPEESGTLIRDQTRSTFLEELVFPFRESIFISGFEPKEDKDAIVVNTKRYRQKIIVKHLKSVSWIRFFVGVGSILYSFYLLRSINTFIKTLQKPPK